MTWASEQTLVKLPLPVVSPSSPHYNLFEYTRFTWTILIVYHDKNMYCKTRYFAWIIVRVYNTIMKYSWFPLKQYLDMFTMKTGSCSTHVRLLSISKVIHTVMCRSLLKDMCFYAPRLDDWGHVLCLSVCYFKPVGK